MSNGLGKWNDPTIWGDVALWVNATSHALYKKYHADKEPVLSDTDGEIISPSSDHIYYLANGDTLQNAIDSLSAAGGTVYILPGYTETITAPVTLVSNLAIRCPSRDAAITDGSVGGIFLFDLQAEDYVTLWGLNYIGGGAAKTSGFLATVAGTPGYGSGWHISRCSTHDCYYGIALGANKGLNQSTIEHFTMDGYARYGFYFNAGCGRTTIKDCHLLSGSGGHTGFIIGGGDAIGGVILERCIASGFAVAGFQIYCRDLIPPELINCRAYNNTGSGFNLRMNSATNTGFSTLVGCIARYNNQHGFYINGSGVSALARFKLIGCHAIDNSRNNANTYSGFYVNAYAEYVSFTDCSAYKLAYAEQKYGFEIVAGASKCEVRGGRWSPNQTGAYLDNGTATILDLRDD